MSAVTVTAAEFIPSPMGGGWIVPQSDGATEICEGIFGEEAEPLPPLNNAVGYIVEPADLADTVEALRNAGCEVRL